MLKIRFFAFFYVLLLMACSSNSNQFDTFLYGRVNKKITVNGIERDYTLHVPNGYQGTKALPLVIVLHDINGSGSAFYQSSGWPAVCQRENVFAVFPSALSYCTKELSGTSEKRIWNTGDVALSPVCNGVNMADDIAFFNQLLERLFIDFNIDKRRIYIAGFGNGGQMSAKAGLEMGGRFAAISQYAGSFDGPGNWNSSRDVPVLFQAGNLDEIFFKEKAGLRLSSLENVINDINNPLSFVALAYKKMYTLQDTFTLAGDTTTVAKALYYKNSQLPLLELSLIRNIGHEYPAGNQSFKAAEQHWNWFTSYVLP